RQVPVLVGIYRRSALGPPRKGREPRRLHEPARRELGDLPDVHGAPVASRLSWAEALDAARLVKPARDAIDPAVAQGLVHRIRPSHARPARSLLVKHDPDLGRGGMVLGQPGTELGWSLEILGLHRSS